MAKKTIFIGSSTESKSRAASVAQGLADAGYQPLRWWNEFPAGSITLLRLLELAKQVDGAAFLFSADDRIWYRGDATDSPRDNVVFEYGVFVAALGKDRTLILRDSTVKLPSDISTITYLPTSEDIETLKERTVAHFTRHFSEFLPPQPEAVSIVADPVLVAQQVNDTLPNGWHNRDLYFGVDGARGWLAAVREPSYSPPAHEIRLRRLLIGALPHVDTRTFVSLGPGDATTDEEIAIELRQREPWLQYIPIDINELLLHHSVYVLANRVRVPIGILGDFEDRPNFLYSQIRTHGTPPFLWTLVGNTLGDLDREEGSFLSSMRNIMGAGDTLLLEVSLAGPKWARGNDRRATHEAYGPGYRRFISTAVARRGGDSIDSVVSNFETRIQFLDGESEIPGTKCIDLWDTKTSRLVCTIRRYEWQSLLEWLRRAIGFKIVHEKSLFIDDAIGDGLVLLKKS